MIIESIELKNYRNYESEKIILDKEKNIFYGANAQGKTNILESLYYCAMGRSHRGSKDNEIIRFGQEEAHIKMFLLKRDLKYRIDIHFKKNNRKGIAINGIPIKRTSDLFGILTAVIFSPEDLNIIKRGPSERRRFIDMELCQVDKTYVHNLVNYNKIIINRNKLLKECHDKRELQEMLDIWDIQLATYGRKVSARRKEFIDIINGIVLDIHREITHNDEIFSLTYEPDTPVERLAEEIARNREKDIRYKSTSTGPHRDDIGFFIGNLDIKKYGSQGQQRTCALSLKLSEIELFKKLTGDTPVLLLDDVLSELDNSRQTHLLKSLNNIQTVITCTGLDDYINKNFGLNRILKVDDGRISE